MAYDENRDGEVLDQEDAAEKGAPSGWVSTEVAAAVLRVPPSTVAELVRLGRLVAKAQGEGGNRTWLVSVESLRKRLREARRTGLLGDIIGADGGHDPTEASSSSAAEEVGGGAVSELIARLEARVAEAADARAKLEQAERTRRYLSDERERLIKELETERAQRERLAKELEAEREERRRERESALEQEQAFTRALEEDRRRVAELEGELERLTKELEGRRGAKVFGRRLFGE